MRLKLEITGMHCAACSAAVESALAALPGTGEHHVDIGKAELTLDDKQCPVWQVIEAIRGAGSFDIASFSKSE